MGLFSKSDKVSQKLLEENEVLRTQLDSILEKVSGLDELESKLADTRAQISDLASNEKELEISLNSMKK